MHIRDYFRGKDTIEVFVKELKTGKRFTLNIPYQTFEELYIRETIMLNHVTGGKHYDALWLA